MMPFVIYNCNIFGYHAFMESCKLLKWNAVFVSYLVLLYSYRDALVSFFLFIFSVCVKAEYNCH